MTGNQHWVWRLGGAAMLALALLGGRAATLRAAGTIGRVHADEVVAQDGSGDFKTVQAALDAVPRGGTKPFVIFIKPGTYKEKLHLDADRPFVHLVGQSAEQTLLTWDDYARMKGPDGKEIGTSKTFSFTIKGHDFTAENLSFENSATPRAVVGQAVAVLVEADRSVFRHCRFLGSQDTLYANHGRQYYQDCLIRGDVDFIFGNAPAVFDGCEIQSIGKGYVTAHSRTDAAQPTGYVFRRCRLTGAAPAQSVYLGRPWRPFARVVYLDCTLGAHVRPEGWDEWNGDASRDATVTYAESGSTGPGASPDARVKWSHQLTADAARAYDPALFLGGDDHWNPAAPGAAAPSLAADAPAQPAEHPMGMIPAPIIPSRVFHVTDYGAKGDGKTKNTAAFQKAIDACGAAGGGVVDVPPGRYLTGPLTLTSSLNLHLNAGATLLLSDDIADYTLTKNRFQDCIAAKNAHDIAITGGGTIDGQGAFWWTNYVKLKDAPAGTPNPPHRPFLVVLTGCRRVLVEGVTLTNSPMFHLVPQKCQDVRIEGIHISSPQTSKNTDGLDPSGWNFVIKGCTFDVGDDCIALKPSGRIAADQPACKDFLIENCTFLHGHGMSVGGQTPGGLEHLTVRDCAFRGTDAGIRLKAPRGSGGLVENLTYENLTMHDVKVPILITSYYADSSPGVTPTDPATDAAQPVSDTTPIWRHIRIRNVSAVGGTVAGEVYGLPEMPVSDVTLTDVNVAGHAGMKIIHARGIRFVRSHVSAETGAPVALVDAQVTGLDVSGRSTASAGVAQ